MIPGPNSRGVGLTVGPLKEPLQKLLILLFYINVDGAQGRNRTTDTVIFSHATPLPRSDRSS